ncbi:PrgI family protein, partial [Candidatus Gottesmanbacteria bacterium]|nr:PrgI family protein [Candidatus Gottesmanbacteria bacterium]
MEQHPVPQNISGFQFKLIGDMTIKQFLFLAGGVLTGYLLLQFKIPGLIKWFLAICAGGAGFAFAFVPIEERPLDRWLVSFFKSIYSPTQFLWKKRAVPPEILTTPISISLPPAPETIKKEETAARIEEYLLTLPTAPVGELDQKEESFVSQVLSSFAPPSPVSQPTPPPQGPQEEFAKKTEELTERITTLQQELTTPAITQERFIEIQAQLSQLLGEKERLTRELVELKKQLAAKPQ